MKNEEVKYLNYQLFALSITLLVTILSIIITYNKKTTILYRKKIIDMKTEDLLNYINKIIILLIALLYLYINYKEYELAKTKGDNLKPFELQIIASIVAIIATLITFYVLIVYKNGITDILNPEL